MLITTLRCGDVAESAGREQDVWDVFLQPRWASLKTWAHQQFSWFLPSRRSSRGAWRSVVVSQLPIAHERVKAAVGAKRFLRQQSRKFERSFLSLPQPSHSMIA